MATDHRFVRVILAQGQAIVLCFVFVGFILLCRFGNRPGTRLAPFRKGLVRALARNFHSEDSTIFPLDAFEDELSLALQNTQCTRGRTLADDSLWSTKVEKIRDSRNFTVLSHKTQVQVVRIQVVQVDLLILQLLIPKSHRGTLDEYTPPFVFDSRTPLRFVTPPNAFCIHPHSNQRRAPIVLYSV